MVVAAIALGSNLGDSQATVTTALNTLDQHPQISVVQCSNWYKTIPVGPPQPDYINGCALLEVNLQPEALMRVLLDVEAQFGRVRQEKNGPRTLDLDLLLFDDLRLDTPQLQIPHPRMADRAFVLVPLSEILPDWVEPITGKTIRDLLQAVDCSGVQKL